MSRIPVFVSCPTKLNERQKKLRKVIIDIIEDLNMEPRALGRSDYPKDFPLKEIAIISKRCSGGIILGFEQTKITKGRKKIDTKEESEIEDQSLPTPWNHIEAGILFTLKLPLLIFKEPKVAGGIFDNGVSDAFVHTFPEEIKEDKQREIKQVVQKWFAEVSIIHNQF